MKLTDNIAQIAANVMRFEECSASDHSYHDAYVELVKNGMCFVASLGRSGPVFTPSRFAGYQNNTLRRHLQNERKDGRETTLAISEIIGFDPCIDTEMEILYKQFCRARGFEPRKRANFGKLRKYWRVGNFDEVLDSIDVDECETDEIDDDTSLDETEKAALKKARIGQGKFRSSLLEYWGESCAVSGCALTRILRASHIKPWSASNNEERLDPFNGLLLTPNLDALFDNGFLSFEDSGQILLSTVLTSDARALLALNDEMEVELEEKHLPYIAFHRKNIFKANYA